MTTGSYVAAGNQPPPLAGYDLFSESRPLAEATRPRSSSTTGHGSDNVWLVRVEIFYCPV